MTQLVAKYGGDSKIWILLLNLKIDNVVWRPLEKGRRGVGA